MKNIVQIISFLSVCILMCGCFQPKQEEKPSPTPSSLPSASPTSIPTETPSPTPSSKIEKKETLDNKTVAQPKKQEKKQQVKQIEKPSVKPTEKPVENKPLATPTSRPSLKPTADSKSKVLPTEEPRVDGSEAVATYSNEQSMIVNGNIYEDPVPETTFYHSARHGMTYKTKKEAWDAAKQYDREHGREMPRDNGFGVAPAYADDNNGFDGADYWFFYFYEVIYKVIIRSILKYRSISIIL